MRLHKYNFYEGHVQIRRQLWRAGCAVGLVKALAEYIKSYGAEGLTSPFLSSTHYTAWTTAVVKCYALLDDNQSLTLRRLIEMGENENPRTKAPFLDKATRDVLIAEMDAIIKAVNHLDGQRNQEEAHIKPEYDVTKVFPPKDKLLAELEDVYKGCLDIVERIERALGRNPLPSDDFYSATKQDMNLIFAGGRLRPLH